MDEVEFTEYRPGPPDPANADGPEPGCCTACDGHGTTQSGYPCEDCYATGHCHAAEVSCDG